MAYTYLFDLYTGIDRRKKQADACGNTPDFCRGQTHFLDEFRSYLSENFDHRLPARLRKRLARNS